MGPIVTYNNQSCAVGWRVGNCIYPSKWQAFEAYANQPTDFGFYYYDHIWDQYDWSQEPSKDLKTLEIEHCQHLRSKYDIIALAYSGGVDSHTVLQRFIDAKVHIDYIFCFASNNSASHISSLEPSTAATYLKQNQHLFPLTKLIFTNENLSIVEKIKNTNSIFNFNGDINSVNFLLRFHATGWGLRLKNEHPDIYQKIEDNNGCIVLGSNKPMVHADQQGFWYVPNDKQDENVQAPELLEFFWSGSNPLLQIKQCHMVKQWMRQHKISNADTVYRTSSPENFVKINCSFGRELPIARLFSIKNCRGKETTGSYFNQEYGGVGQNNIFASILESRVYDKNLKKLYTALQQYSRESMLAQMINDQKNRVDIVGWRGKARYLGI